MQVTGGRDAAAAGIGPGLLSDAAEPLICEVDILENGAENGSLAQGLCQDPLAMTCPGDKRMHMCGAMLWGSSSGPAPRKLPGLSNLPQSFALLNPNAFLKCKLLTISCSARIRPAEPDCTI